MAIQYKTPAQMAIMARAGVIVEAALAAAREAAVIAEAGATSNFLGYHGFPATTCVSVNDEVVHGIPGPRVLNDGDVVSIDCGAIVEGWHGDSAITVVLGDNPDPADVALSESTHTALWAGIAALARAKRLNEVGEAVEDVAIAAGLHPIDGYIGHGIGTEMHQDPDVLNYRVRARLAKVRPGMCVAIEPMFVRGTSDSRVLEDDWTVVSADGSRAAHWEHSIAVHERGIWVLTASDGGAEGLAAFGVTPVRVG